MNIKEKSVRIGRINYTNVWPLFHYFPFSKFGNQIEFTLQVPTGLNKAMALGEIDMGPISSFSYGEHFEEYMIYPDFSVSAQNAVKSILLFHRKPIEEIKNGKIALPTTSATSVNLLKIILEKFYGGQPQYDYASPSLNDMMVGTDAALLIGDDAIKASWMDHGYMVTDLGEEWRKWTGYGMTFAVWAIRKDTAKRHANLMSELYEGFLESKTTALTDPTSMIHEAQAAIGGTEQYWKEYFSGLCYEFGPTQFAGLQLYYQYAWELGFLPKQVELNIWSNDSTQRVKA